MSAKHPGLVSFTAMDVSADLTELGRTPIAVVCAGAKSLLDIGRTLEFLVRELLCLPSRPTKLNHQFPS